MRQAKTHLATAEELLELVLSKQLRPTDVRVYQAIRGQSGDEGGPLTLVAIARRVGLKSHATALHAVRRLERRGLIESREDGNGLRICGLEGPAPELVGGEAIWDPRYERLRVAACCATCAHWRPARVGRHGCVGNSHERAGLIPTTCCGFYTRRV